MSIEVDETVWEPVPEQGDPTTKVWHDGDGVTLVLNSIGFDRDLFSRLSDEQAVREYYRDQFAEQSIGIVECNVLEKDGKQIVKTIGKSISEGQPVTYIASVAIPLSDRSYVFSLYAQEQGITGVRDTAIMTKLMLEGHLCDPDIESGTILGWAQDPYFPEYQGPCLRNLSEDEKYDPEFPDHPLSKVRMQVNKLVEFITLSTDSTQSSKQWWKVW